MRGVVKVTFPWIILCFNLVSDCHSGTLLLATERGIKILDPVTSDLTTVLKHPASSVDFRYNKKDLYFISGNQILYSYYSEFLGDYSEPIPIITAEHRLLDLVVDWRRFKLYYILDWASPIYEADLLGSTIATIDDTHQDTVTDIALDVYDGRYFYVENGFLYMSFPHRIRSLALPPFVFITDTDMVFSVSKVAVDHHNRTVYVVGYDYLHLQWRLLSADYNNMYTTPLLVNSTLVFNGPELARPFALEVFDDEVLWGSLSQDKYTIYSCRLTPACDIDHLEIVYQSNEAIHDVKFYNSIIQTLDTATACAELACSHSCKVVSRYVVNCSCPSGLSLYNGGNTCIESSSTSDVTEVWLEELRSFLLTLADMLLQWLTSQSSNITTLILACCLVMLILLSCGLCLLWCAREPKRSMRLSEAYDLSETRHRAATGGEANR